MSAVQEAVKSALEQPLKLDIGCGKNKKEGFYGVDIIDFDGVDIVADLRESVWLAKRAPEELKPRMVKYLQRYDRNGVFLEAGEFWSLPANSVDEVHCSHFLEHLTNLDGKWERVNFFNELFRILKPGAQAHLVFPHWCSNRHYGDPTHKEPFSEMGFYYLKREWRIGKDGAGANAPHTDISFNPNGYRCDFDATWGYSLHPHLKQGRHQDYVQHALQFWKEAAADIIATLTKPAVPQ